MTICGVPETFFAVSISVVTYISVRRRCGGVMLFTYTSCPNPALFSTSRAMIGEMPCKTDINALESSISRGKASIRAMISSTVQVSMESLSCGGGKRYKSPGNTRRSEDISASTRFSASMILPFSSTKMILLYRPMISTASVSSTWSPSSFTLSNFSMSARSKSGCVISKSFAPCNFLRKSMHSIGGCCGFSTGIVVRLTRALFARAEMSSLYAALKPRNARISSSRFG